MEGRIAVADLHLGGVDHGADQNQLVLILKVSAAIQSPVAFLNLRRAAAGQVFLRAYSR